MSKYNPDMPFYLSRSIARAQRKLAELRLREEIYAIDQKLQALRACEKYYPPECVGGATTSPNADGGGQSLQPPSPAGRRLLSLESAK